MSTDHFHVNPMTEGTSNRVQYDVVGFDSMKRVRFQCRSANAAERVAAALNGGDVLEWHIEVYTPFKPYARVAP